MRRLALNRKTIIGFSVVLLFQLFLSFVAYHSVIALMEVNSRVAHTEEVLTTLESLLAQAQDVEVERGFLLTGNDLFLAPYETARQAIQPTLQRLQQLTTDNPLIQVQLATLESLIKQRLTLAQRVMEVQQDKGSEVAIRLVQSGRGRALMAEIHSLVDDLRSEEIAVLQQQQITGNRDGRIALWGILLSVVVTLFFVAFAGSILHQGQTKRKAAERALLQVYLQGEPRLEGRVDTPSPGNDEMQVEGGKPLYQELVLQSRRA